MELAGCRRLVGGLLLGRCRLRCRLIPPESDIKYCSKEHVARKSAHFLGFSGQDAVIRCHIRPLSRRAPSTTRPPVPAADLRRNEQILADRSLPLKIVIDGEALGRAADCRRKRADFSQMRTVRKCVEGEWYCGTWHDRIRLSAWICTGSAKISGPAWICTNQRPSAPLFPVVREDEALQLRLGSEIE